MKLELKHLAIAFTNNWKVTYFDDERELNQVCNIVELREDECTISNGEYEYDVKFDDIKLLCFPISSLTKEDVKNFYQFNNDDFKSIDLKEWAEDLMFFIKTKEPFQLSQFEYLLSKKFDVFGLIELGLAEPVTEDFNPYK